VFCLAIYSGFSKNRIYPRVTETCKDCGFPLVLTLMPRATAALGAGTIRAQLCSEMTFCSHTEILSSCDLVAVVINSNHRISLVYNFKDDGKDISFDWRNRALQEESSLQ
jgi:hypothetical protein